MARTEQQYFDFYNKLNTRREYEMVCRQDMRTGTSFLQRVCQPRFMEKAQQTAASDRVRSAIAAGDSATLAGAGGPNVGATSADNTSAVASANEQELFRKNMLEVPQSSLELQEIAQRRDDLQTRYRDATAGK